MGVTFFDFLNRTPLLPVYFIILEDMAFEGRVQLWNILRYKSENIIKTFKFQIHVTCLSHIKSDNKNCFLH